MSIARSIRIESGDPNKVSLNWLAPIGFNLVNDEIIITRTTSHYPVELFNSSFEDKATDNRPIEIFRGQTIAGINTGTISAAGTTLTDTSASFPTATPLKGRLIRDANSKVHRIASNTATSITTAGTTIANGKYVVLPDFPSETRPQDNFEADSRTTAGAGFIKNLVVISNGSPTVKVFDSGELQNLIFQDSAGTKFIIKSNTTDTVTLFGSLEPVLGSGMRILNSFVDSQPVPYIDNFLTEAEAAARTGTGLLDNTFYYYTVFTKEIGTNVAQAEFSSINSGTPTQGSALSNKDRNFGTLLYELWPSIYRELDSTEDLKDLMEVFGFQFNSLHALVDTYKLQDTDRVFVTALLPLSEQTGLPAVGYAIGADTLRRIAKDMISCWRLKGSKEGIAIFIRKITTWDVTGGTADFSSAIEDLLPNVEALRFFDPNFGNVNSRLTQTDPTFVAGGRFAQGLPGIVIPGFFTFREFVINIPNVALYTGASEGFSVTENTTTMVDTGNNFGVDNSLVGNFLLPNEEEINDIFEIIGNTANTITVKGIITNRNSGGNYAILSPLNTSRFVILNRLLPVYIPFGTRQGFRFT